MALPVPQSSLLGRRVFALPLIVLLWTAATPFTPVSWFMGSFSGALIVDRFVAGLALLCACYFQFQVSGLTHPIAVSVPNPFVQQSEQYVYNGRVRYRNPEVKTDVGFFYHPEKFWTYALAEAGVLLFAEFCRVEILRRALVLVVVSGLWMVGWMITPQSTKRWAWGHIKVFWFFIVWDLIRDVGFGGGGGGRRRGRRG